MSNPPQASRKEWAAVTRLEAFKKWRRQTTLLTAAVTNAILEAVQVRPAMTVLDLASGAGEPALSLCAAVGAEGRVTATDLAPELLALAQEFARERDIRNVSLALANAESLPFDDRKFDCVTCRFGVMYFASPLRALREAWRVLKPGGRAVFAVWTAPEQPIFATTVGVLVKHVRAPLGESKASDPFSFANPGRLSGLMREAEFQQVQEEARNLSLIWSGSPEQYWEYFQENTAPFRQLIDALTPAVRPQVAAEVYQAAGEYFDGRQINFPGVILLVSGLR